MTAPWTPEKRAAATRRIKKEAARAADRLGAERAVLIVFFRDGEHLHMLEAGNPPMEYVDLHKHLVSADAMLAESGGKDVALS